MGIVFPQSAHDQVIGVPEGVTVGRISLTRNGCTFRGSDGYAAGERPPSILRLDNTSPYGIQAGAVVGGGACVSVTFEDMTIDADNISTMVAMFASNLSGGPVYVTFRRCWFINFHKNAIAISCAAHLVLEDVTIQGNGLPVQIGTGSLGARIVDFHSYGGTGGIIVGGVNGSISGILIKRAEIIIDFWQTAPGESVTPTSFEAQRVLVSSHDHTARSLTDAIVYEQPIGTYEVGDDLPDGARDFDRVELADGRWGQVLDGEIEAWRAAGQTYEVDEPTGETATLYRIWLGKVWGWSESAPHYLSIALGGGAELGHWRGVEGTATIVRGATEVDPSANTITLRIERDDGDNVGHGLATGDGPVRLVAMTTLPTGLAAATDYYAIRVDDETIKLATSEANAIAGTAVDITAVGVDDFAVLRIPEIVVGGRMRVLRAGIREVGQTRDVDSGAVHVTDGARAARVLDVTTRGGFSDNVTCKGKGENTIKRVVTRIGWDMGQTYGITGGVQNLEQCEARQAGYKGFYFTGPATVRNCRPTDNGLHDEGDADSCGVSADVGVEIEGSFIGNGGRDGMIKTGADVTIIAPETIHTLKRSA